MNGSQSSESYGGGAQGARQRPVLPAAAPTPDGAGRCGCQFPVTVAREKCLSRHTSLNPTDDLIRNAHRRWTWTRYHRRCAWRPLEPKPGLQSSDGTRWPPGSSGFKTQESVTRTRHDFTLRARPRVRPLGNQALPLCCWKTTGKLIKQDGW